MTDEDYMREAIQLAKQAYNMGEVPVGAVIVCGDRIVGRGYNRRETDKNALCHAELMAIDDACRTLGGWRLWQCRLYVTLEPCPMCAGAIINARIPQIFFGAYDPKSGSCHSVIDLFSFPYNHKPTAVGGLFADECSSLLSQFFKSRRKNVGALPQTPPKAPPLETAKGTQSPWIPNIFGE